MEQKLLVSVKHSFTYVKGDSFYLLCQTVEPVQFVTEYLASMTGMGMITTKGVGEGSNTKPLSMSELGGTSSSNLWQKAEEPEVLYSFSRVTVIHLQIYKVHFLR